MKNIVFAIALVVAVQAASAKDFDKEDTLKGLDAIISHKMEQLTENTAWNTTHSDTVNSLQKVLDALSKPYDTTDFKKQVQNESLKVQGLSELLRLGGVDAPKNVDPGKVAKTSKIDDIRSLREFVQELRDKEIPLKKTKELSKQASSYFTEALGIIDALAKKGEVEGVDPITRLKREVAALGASQSPYPTISKVSDRWQVTPLRPTDSIADLIKVMEDTRDHVSTTCPTAKEISTQSKSIDNLLFDNMAMATQSKVKRDAAVEMVKSDLIQKKANTKSNFEVEIQGLTESWVASQKDWIQAKAKSLQNATTSWDDRQRSLIQDAWKNAITLGIILDKGSKGLEKPLTISGVPRKMSEVYEMLTKGLIIDSLSENFESEMHGRFVKIAESSIREVREDAPSFKGIELLSALGETTRLMDSFDRQGAQVIIKKLDMEKAKKLPAAIATAKETALAERKTTVDNIEKVYSEKMSSGSNLFMGTKEKLTKAYDHEIELSEANSRKSIANIVAVYDENSKQLSSIRASLTKDKAVLTSCLGELGAVHSRVQELSNNVDEKSHFESINKDISQISKRVIGAKNGR